jgi:hypothetical protein
MIMRSLYTSYAAKLNLSTAYAATADFPTDRVPAPVRIRGNHMGFI